MVADKDGYVLLCQHTNRRIVRVAKDLQMTPYIEKFEGKLNASGSNLMRAAVDLAKDWRQDRALRRLEALLLVGNPEHLLVLSGTGDVIEPDEGIAAIGSGGPYAQAAAMALLHHSDLDAEAIAREALKIASQICIYTNDDITVETA